MNRSLLIVFLEFALISQIPAAESPEGKAIHDVLEARVVAQLDSDFPKLASLLHPTAQRLFRDQLSARFDELLRTYSLSQVNSVSGLPQHPKDLKLSDPEFFVVACAQAKARHPDFVGDSKYLSFDIRGAVFHGDSRVDVELGYNGHVVTERTAYDYVLPFVIVLQREQAQWQVLSCPLAHIIAYNWSRDLACATRPTR
jgi:hypothetical protein